MSSLPPRSYCVSFQCETEAQPPSLQQLHFPFHKATSPLVSPKNTQIVTISEWGSGHKPFLFPLGWTYLVEPPCSYAMSLCFLGWMWHVTHTCWQSWAIVVLVKRVLVKVPPEWTITIVGALLSWTFQRMLSLCGAVVYWPMGSLTTGKNSSLTISLIRLSLESAVTVRLNISLYHPAVPMNTTTASWDPVEQWKAGRLKSLISHAGYKLLLHPPILSSHGLKFKSSKMFKQGG